MTSETAEPDNKAVPGAEICITERLRDHSERSWIRGDVSIQRKSLEGTGALG